MRPSINLFRSLLLFFVMTPCLAFLLPDLAFTRQNRSQNGRKNSLLGESFHPLQQEQLAFTTTSSFEMTVSQASTLLSQWDQMTNPDRVGTADAFNITTSQLQEAVLVLNQAATLERTKDSTMGRCLLGICADSAPQGIETLKSWVKGLHLPRGLLHGMDQDGVPLDVQGGVYIKYNSGGVLSFSDIRKSGLGFDALWKPGDALLEPYEGTYRGVYFQVELEDQEFRQYLVPLDLFPQD
jgi:hypothetical protein